MKKSFTISIFVLLSLVLGCYLANHLRIQKDSYYNDAKEHLLSNSIYHEGMTFEEAKGYYELLDTVSKYTNSPYWMDNDHDCELSEPYDNFRKCIADKFNSKIFMGFPDGPYNDSIVITDSFLSKNVERSIEIWKNSPYAKKLKFKEFCEMILPYRAYSETFPKSKEELFSKFDGILKVSEGNGLEAIINRYKNYVKRCRWMLRHVDINTHTNYIDMYIPKFVGECQNTAAWTCDILRACGIPCVIEYTPQWQDRPRAHFWCCALDTDGILKPFTPPDNNLFEDWESDLQYAGKVYRINFGVNKECPYFIAGPTEIIPESLSSPFISDETQRYHSTITLAYPISKKIQNKVGYLCFFDRNCESGLSAVAWGNIDHTLGHIIFKKVPIDMIFFPAIMSDNQQLVPIGNPFEIRSKDNGFLRKPHSTDIYTEIKEPFIRIKGDILLDDKGIEKKSLIFHTFNPSSETTNMSVTRKNPLKRVLLKSHKKLIGAKWIASNSLEGIYDTIATLDFIPKPYLQEIRLSSPVKYRYVKFITSDSGPVNIAHMEFLSEKNMNGCEAPTPLPIHDDKTAYDRTYVKLKGTPLQSGRNPGTAFDGNMETYAGSKYIGLDFGRSTEFSCLRFAPRNANNGIVRGDEYELYIYDNGWKLMDTTVAEREYIEFNNMPLNAIYWLKNTTRGNEEHPFFYEVNSGQQFINKTD